jgi:hypothetical protein
VTSFPPYPIQRTRSTRPWTNVIRAPSDQPAATLNPTLSRAVTIDFSFGHHTGVVVVVVVVVVIVGTCCSLQWIFSRRVW